MITDTASIIRNKFHRLEALFQDFFNGYEEVKDSQNHSIIIEYTHHNGDYQRKVNEINKYWQTQLFDCDDNANSKNYLDQLFIFKNAFIRFYNHCITQHFGVGYKPGVKTGVLNSDIKSINVYKEDDSIIESILFQDQEVILYDYLQHFKQQLIDANIITHQDLVKNEAKKLDEITDSHEHTRSNKNENKIAETEIYTPIVQNEKLASLHSLLIDNGVIENIDFGDFRKCFDLNKTPPIPVTPAYQMMLVYVLMQIDGVNQINAKKNFSVNNYDKHKGYINQKIDGVRQYRFPEKRRLLARKIERLFIQ
jgi:hypothetical protein